MSPALVHDDGNKFYDTAQIEDVWDTIVRAYPPMPPGYGFPDLYLDEEFEEGIGKDGAVFQVGVPEHSAVTYWRCAWLEAATAARKSGDAQGLAEADARLSRKVFLTLPGMTSKRAAEYFDGVPKGTEVDSTNTPELDYGFRCGLWDMQRPDS